MRRSDTSSMDFAVDLPRSLKPVTMQRTSHSSRVVDVRINIARLPIPSHSAPRTRLAAEIRACLGCNGLDYLGRSADRLITVCDELACADLPHEVTRIECWLAPREIERTHDAAERLVLEGVEAVLHR